MFIDPEQPSELCNDSDSAFYGVEPCQCASCKFTNDSHRCVDDPCDGCDDPTPFGCGIQKQFEKEEVNER